MKAVKKPARQTMPLAGLERVYIIDREIASGRFPNTDDLVESMKQAEKECRGKKASKATISRDIEFMKNRFNAPIEYSAYERGYYYSDKTYRLPAGFTKAEDLVALNMAKSIFSLYRDTPLYEASKNILDCILAPINSDTSNDWLDNRIIVPRIATAKVDSDIWEVIISAIKQNRIINFYYHGTWDDKPKLRKVQPYQILFDSGIWYLYGYSEERKATRIFSLSWMTKVSISNETFNLPKNYSYSDFSGDSYFGIFIGQEKKQYAIECYDEAQRYATERQWAADQKNIKKSNSSVIEFTSTQYDKVLKWVLSCGCNAVPRKPKKLVEDWNWHILEMKKLAKKV